MHMHMHMLSKQVILQRGHGKPVDLWALGCMLLELLHGKSPFAAPHAHASYQLTLQVGLGLGETLSSGFGWGLGWSPVQRARLHVHVHVLAS